MSLVAEEAGPRLAAYLRRAWGADAVRVSAMDKLGGGAIQENWALDLDADGGARPGRHTLVLRTDAPTRLDVSHGRIEEFTLLKAAFEAGVTVPEPILAEPDHGIIGQPFALMTRIAGTAVGTKVVRTLAPTIGGEALAERLGRELAAIHAITPHTHRFPFLRSPSPDPATAEIAAFRRHLDTLALPYPAIEWGLRHLEGRMPAAHDLVLVHHDFRTGNYMLDGEAGLTGILDWEFAGWSDPHEDLGWFCAACWRFGERAKEAGGIGSRAAFYRGYEAVSGRRIDEEAVAFWEIFAHIRWAVIAVQQGERFTRGRERSLELALTGRRAPEMEWEILAMTASASRANEVADRPPAAMHAFDEPDAAAILDVAADTLRERLLPLLANEARLDALMALSGMGIAARTLERFQAARPSAASDARPLAAAIRAGRHDGDARLHARLVAEVRARLAVANPKYLAALEG